MMRQVPRLMGILLILLLLISSAVAFYLTRDSDNDGIPDVKERELGTNPYNPDLAVSYALKKLPSEIAKKFKSVEFNSSTRKLIDACASLPEREKWYAIPLLTEIIKDGKVDEKEVNLFNDAFVSKVPPSISYAVEKNPEECKVTLNINVKDESGVSSLSVIFRNESTFTCRQSCPIDNISLPLKLNELPLNTSARVTAIDFANNTNTVEVPIIWDKKDSSLCYLVRNGIPAKILGDFYDSHPSLVEMLYPENKERLLRALTLYTQYEKEMKDLEAACKYVDHDTLLLELSSQDNSTYSSFFSSLSSLSREEKEKYLNILFGDGKISNLDKKFIEFVNTYSSHRKEIISKAYEIMSSKNLKGDELITKVFNEDWDNDGITNLQEMQEKTDPFIANVPVAPVYPVPPSPPTISPTPSPTLPDSYIIPNVPFYPQIYPWDCWAATNQMILGYYGIQISQDEQIKMCTGGEIREMYDGCPELSNWIFSQGFCVKDINSLEDALKALYRNHPLKGQIRGVPRWHYVVVIGYDKKEGIFYILDPLFGQRAISFEELCPSPNFCRAYVIYPCGRW